MAFFFGVGTHTDTAHRGTAKRDVALGVCGLDANKVPLIYTNNHSSQVRAVDADPATKGASITSFEDPAYTGTDYMSNGFFDGTNWNRYDITIPCHSLYHDAANDEISFWRSEPAANPITNWVKFAAFETDGSDNFNLSILRNTVLTPAPVIASGTYTGNSTVNRAVAHGLVSTPKLILIRRDGQSSYVYCILDGQLYATADTTNRYYNPTDPEATNFYVGDAADYSASANFTGVVYNWVAIG